MLAEYNGNIYIANVKSNQVVLLTYDYNKVIDGFERNKDYFKKVVSIDDPLLKNIYEIHYWVKYNDNSEKEGLLRVDEDRAVGLKADVENDIVVIDIPYNALDDTWLQYDNGAAAKRINLLDCTEYYIEKRFIKYNKKTVNEVIEKKSVSLDVMKASMIMSRRVNL